MGVPLRIDQTTVTSEAGHFARVLVVMDLPQHVPYYVLLDTENGNIDVSISYENLLECLHSL